MSLKSMVLVAAVVSMVLASEGAATAATSHNADPGGDAGPRVDITHVTYRNGPSRVSAKIAVADLRRGGRAELVIGPPVDSDGAYVAILEIDRTGHLDMRFRLSTNTGNVRARCHFRARWDERRDSIAFSVPQKCVSGMGGEALYLGTSLSSGNQRDEGPVVRRLARG